MDVEFTDLTFTVPGPIWKSKVPGKAILKGVSGRFRPGQLSAILGPSGAGKSSLLNAISGYRLTGVTGQLLTNSQPRDERLFRKCSCYITQDDLLQPFLTLKELMTFAAKLKLPSTMSTEERSDVVSEIIDEIGLTSSQDTFTDKLSGGQKKRLSIALELINNHPVFFLDEPTSGLDNVAAKQCLQILKTLAQQNRTIVCTIHQPSASLFEMFDLIYVVSQGVCVYQGTTMGLLPFLSSVGLNCPISYNPADYVIEITNGDEPHNIQLLSNAIDNGKLAWNESDGETITDCITALQVLGPTGRISNGVMKFPEFEAQMFEWQALDMQFPTSSWSQFLTIYCRMMKQIGRNTISLWTLLIHHILCSTILGILFYDTAQDANEWYIHLKIITAINVVQTYTWMMVPVLAYPPEVKLLQREHFNRWYRFSSYYMALTMSTLPAKIFYGLIFLTNIYYLFGMPFEVVRFPLFCLVGIMVGLITEGIGYSIGSTFNVTNGSALGPALLAPLMGLGFYGYDFAKEISTFMKLVMRTSVVRCGIVTMTLTVLGFDRPTLGCSDQFGYCHFRDPKTLLEVWDFNTKSFPIELSQLFGMLLAYRFAFFLLLRRRLKT